MKCLKYNDLDIVATQQMGAPLILLHSRLLGQVNGNLDPILLLTAGHKLFHLLLSSLLTLTTKMQAPCLGTLGCSINIRWQLIHGPQDLGNCELKSQGACEVYSPIDSCFFKPHLNKSQETNEAVYVNFSLSVVTMELR